MRGEDQKRTAIFGYLTLAQRIPADHPARQIRVLVDRAVAPRQERAPELEIALGADPLYREEMFVGALREREIAPHVGECTKDEQNLTKNSLTEEERAGQLPAIDRKKRKLIEKVFGRATLDTLLRQAKVRGLDRVDWLYRLAMAAYNLMRMRRLIPIQPAA
ncbi:MAG: transposase [Terracidiphilus sp.]